VAFHNRTVFIVWAPTAELANERAQEQSDQVGIDANVYDIERLDYEDFGKHAGRLIWESEARSLFDAITPAEFEMGQPALDLEHDPDNHPEGAD
jgi:hypothetical protein